MGEGHTDYKRYTGGSGEARRILDYAESTYSSVNSAGVTLNWVLIPCKAAGWRHLCPCIPSPAISRDREVMRNCHNGT